MLTCCVDLKFGAGGAVGSDDVDVPVTTRVSVKDEVCICLPVVFEVVPITFLP